MSDLTDTDRELGYTDLEEISMRAPEAAVAWDRDIAQRRRITEATKMRFRWRRGGRLVCYFHNSANWRMSRRGNIARAPSEKLEWMSKIDTWVYTVEVLVLDAGFAPPDLRPFSLEYTEYPKNRLSDHVKLEITISDISSEIMATMCSMEKVPYTDEGWPLLTRAFAGAVQERDARREAVEKFEASFKPLESDARTTPVNPGNTID